VGSIGEFGARQLLREYGISYDDLKSWGGSVTHVGYKVIVDAMRDGRSDLLIAVVTPKHPSITEIATFADVKFLPLEPERVKGLTALGYEPATMPANEFKNQPEPIPTVGFPTVLIANAELSDAIAYTITKTICESKDALVRGHAGLAVFEPAVAWKPEKVGIPLHPGAERYYREKGWLREPPTGSSRAAGSSRWTGAARAPRPSRSAGSGSWRSGRDDPPKGAEA
jgi:TRAP transporter TAXI family solute receptor